MARALHQVADLFKGRHKGSRNKRVKYIARFYDLHGEPIYVYPDKKEVDEDGNLKPGIRAASVIRRFFGVETSGDIAAREAVGLRFYEKIGGKKVSTSPSSKYLTRIHHLYTPSEKVTTDVPFDPKTGEVTGRERKVPFVVKVPGTAVGVREEKLKTGKVVRDFEVIDEHKRDFRNGFPASISQFFTEPEDLEAAGSLTVLGVLSDEPTAVNAEEKKKASKKLKEHELNKFTDTPGTKVEHKVGKHIAAPTIKEQPPLQELENIVDYVRDRDPVALAWELQHAEKKKSKEGDPNDPGSVGFKVGDVNPHVLEKFGDAATLQNELHFRPMTTFMTAGMVPLSHGQPILSNIDRNRLVDEWTKTIYNTARAAVARLRTTPHYSKERKNDELAGLDPNQKNSAAGHYIAQNISDYTNETIEKFFGWIKDYRPKINDPSDRFDKWMYSKIENHITKRIHADLSEYGGDPIVEAEEVAGTTPGSSGPTIPPEDWHEYHKFAAEGKHRIRAVLKELPEDYSRIIKMHLWLDSPEASKRERELIAKRGIKNTENRQQFDMDEASVEGISASQRPQHWQRSFADIVRDNPTGWKFKIDNTTPHGRASAEKALARLYERAVGELSTKLTTPPKVQAALAAHAVDLPKGWVHHPGIDMYFTRENWSAYKFLQLEAKRTALGLTIPRAPTFYTKRGMGPTPGKVIAVPPTKPAAKASVSAALSYFHGSKELASKLGFAEWKPIMVPAGSFTSVKHGDTPVESAHRKGGGGPVSPIHHRYGLPELAHDRIDTTPEQKRRTTAMVEAYRFMREIDPKRTSSVEALRTSAQKKLTKLSKVLKTETPRSLASLIYHHAARLTNEDKDTRKDATAKLRGVLTQFFHTEQLLGTGTKIGSQIWDLVKDARNVTAASKAYNAVQKIGLEEAVVALDVAQHKERHQLVMLDHELAERKAVVKSEDLDWAPASMFTGLLLDLSKSIETWRGFKKSEALFPQRVYEEQRDDVRKVIERRSTLVPGEIALRPSGKIDGYVGIFYADSDAYLFSYSSGSGFVFKRAADEVKAAGKFDAMNEEENYKSLERRRIESDAALTNFMDAMNKSFLSGDPPDFTKAFPKKEAASAPVKQAPKMVNAGSKQAGAGGKTRYGYSAQAKENKGRPSGPGDVNAIGGDQPEKIHYVDPSKIANQLKTTPQVLRNVANRFQSNPKMKGKSGFVEFFMGKFGAFAKKHDLSRDYFEMLYDSLLNPHPQVVAQGKLSSVQANK